MSDLGARRFTIPLPGGRQVAIEGDFPLTETEWELFAVVLNTMKPGLTEDAGSTT